MTEHKHRDVKHWPNDDFGPHGTQVEECSCRARRETDPRTGKWTSWRFATLAEDAKSEGTYLHMHTSGGDPTCDICVALVGLDDDSNPDSNSTERDRTEPDASV